jgi:two-component system sensor histidine kinase UhpB
MKSLRYQLNIRILFLSCCVLLIGILVTLWQAKRAVQDEMQSSIHLAEQLIVFNLSQRNLDVEWLTQLNTLKETRHLHIQLQEPSGEALNVSPPPTMQNSVSEPPHWFVNLVASSPMKIERTVITGDGQQFIVSIEANPLNELSEIWQESVAFFSLLLSLISLIFLAIHIVFSRMFKEIVVIVRGVEGIGGGDYQHFLPDFSSEEINCIAKAINQLIEKLNFSQAENRALTQHNLTIQEQERQHLAQELHDELGQSLTAIKVMTSATARVGIPQNPLIKQSTDAVIETCNHLMLVVRLMMQQLHPLILTELGLKAALEDLISHWQMRYMNLKIAFNCDEDIETLPENICIHIFRIVQECLTNTVRHANATQVFIDLTLAEDNFLTLRVSDNGKGCEMQNIKKGFGLLSMRERIRSLDGEFLIETTPTCGMKINVKIPL